MDNQNSNWKSKLLLTGTFAGAMLGFTTAYLMARDAEKDGNQLNLTSGDLMRAAPSVIAVMRQLTTIGR